MKKKSKVTEAVEKSLHTETTRRDFLKKGTTAGALAAGGLAMTLLPKKAEARPYPAPPKWDKEFDIIVIGSGFAGLAAAITAKEAGQDVIILDRCPSAAEIRLSMAVFSHR